MEKDFIKRYVDNDIDQDLCSPMEPPDLKAPSTEDKIPEEDFHPFLQSLMKEHREYERVLNLFENALLELKQKAWKFDSAISTALKEFFEFYDEKTTQHNRKEEKLLFPVLRRHLIESGETNPEGTVTPVEVMEDEHEKVSQSVALVFNFLGLAPRMKDAQDREMILEHAVGLGQEIVETMKVHIFKEDTVLWPLAQKWITPKEWVKISESPLGQ